MTPEPDRGFPVSTHQAPGRVSVSEARVSRPISLFGRQVASRSYEVKTRRADSVNPIASALVCKRSQSARRDCTWGILILGFVFWCFSCLSFSLLGVFLMKHAGFFLFYDYFPIYPFAEFAEFAEFRPTCLIVRIVRIVRRVSIDRGFF
jgi:hypothetical protein